MDDLAHEWTDEQIEALAKRMHEVYQQASDEMADKLKSWMEDYDRKNKAWKDEVKAGTRTKAEYDEWLKRRASERSWYQSMIDTLSQDAVRSDILCRQMINDEIPTVMAECANIEGFEIDRAIRLDTSFTLYNHDSIHFALKDPILYPQLDIPKDLAWNQQKFASAITQSILQGESIPNTAKRLDSVFKMGEVSSVRAARTAMTYAESTGRLASMRRAEALGVPLMKVWRANLDERTRQAHREADGQTVGLDEKFIVDGYEMEGPGDPTAPGALVYNCFVGETYVCSDTDIVRSYKHSFTGKFVTVNTASGIEFTCTENHPILTPSGWVASNLLNEGDYLVSACVGDCEVPSGNPSVDKVMTSIEALHELLGMLPVKRGSCLGVDFHGDVSTSDVEVISKERMLGVDGDARVDKGVSEVIFEDSDLSASGNGTSMLGLGGVLHSPSGRLGCERVRLSFIWGHVGHSDEHGLGGVSRGYTMFPENSIDNISAMPNLDGESLDGLSGKVGLDQIVSVKVTNGTRHVYNLQTENGYYFVGNPNNGSLIIAKNCRCRPLREIGYKDIPPRVTMRYNRLPKGMTYEDWKAGKKPDKPTAKKKQGIKQTVKPPAKKKPIDVSKIKTKGQWVPK